MPAFRAKVSVVAVLFLLVTGITVAEVPALNLEDAVNQALERNLDIVSATLDLELARLDLQKAETDQVLAPNPSLLRQRRLAVERAADHLNTVTAKTRQEVRRQAFNLLKLQDLVSLSERKLVQAREDLSTVQLKIELNLEGETARLGAQRDLIAAEKALADAIAAVEVARMSFLQYIGAEKITNVFALEVSDFELEMETWEEQKALELALNQTPRIVTTREQLEGAQLDMKLNDAGFTPPTDRRKYEIALLKAERAFAEEEKTVRVQVRQFISDIASLHSELAMAELAVQVAEAQLAAEKVKLDQGMITKAQLAAQENAVFQARQSLLDTKFRIRDRQQELREYLGL